MKNPQLKERFLIDKPKTYNYILSKVYNYEDQLNKDMCEFTIDEWFNILNDKDLFNLKSNQNKHSLRKVFADYMDFAINERFVLGINIFRSGLIL